MKPLTDKEISFMKATKWSPTIVQMSYSKNELKRTPYAGYEPADAQRMYELTAERYGINLDDLYDKTCNLDDSDGISLEEEATYLFYTFFSSEELLEMDLEYALSWLKDFKYYFGYRKWSKKLVEQEIIEAIEVYAGSREFYILDDGNIWSREKED